MEIPKCTRNRITDGDSLIRLNYAAKFNFLSTHKGRRPVSHRKQELRRIQIFGYSKCGQYMQIGHKHYSVSVSLNICAYHVSKA